MYSYFIILLLSLVSLLTFISLYYQPIKEYFDNNDNII